VEGVTWFVLMFLVFGMPLLLGLLWVSYARMKGGAERKERQQARDAWERVMNEKLDVLKTAIVMGYDYSELAQLDKRLGSLIGEERMQGLLTERQVPYTPAADLRSIEDDVAAVVQLARQHREKQ
jgi:hypothetical protein